MKFNLKKLRNQKKLSIREMADLLGMDKDLYRAYEANRVRSLKFELGDKMCHILQVSLDELISLDN